MIIFLPDCDVKKRVFYSPKTDSIKVFEFLSTEYAEDGGWIFLGDL